MAPLPSKAGSLLRVCQRQSLRPLCPLATAQQRRTKADIVERTAGEFDETPKIYSPFKNQNDNPSTKVPSFGKYMSKRGETSNKTFSYFMVGAMGLLSAAGAKATVQGRVTQSHADGDYGSNWRWEDVKKVQLLTMTPTYRFPSQHVRLSGRTRTG